MPDVADAPRIVFLGPSISVDFARRVLPAGEFRPPIRRGDLQDVEPGSIVGIVDGLFAQTLAISPGEIREAIGGGVIVYGAASMGALRAAEVGAVVGVGRVFEMYRSGTIERDDEVAILVDADSNAALTEPLVNVRFAVDRLVRTGTLRSDDGAAIVEAAQDLHFEERTYRNILAHSRLADRRDVDDLIGLLKTFDLKRDDAQLLLETLASAAPAVGGDPPPRPQRRRQAHARAKPSEPATARLSVWESGDSAEFEDLVRFLKVTGAFEPFARRAIGRMAAGNTPLRPSVAVAATDLREPAQALLDGVRTQWGWESAEEAHTTMRDLGLGLDDVGETLDAEVILMRLVGAFGRAETDEFQRALRAELWLNELALKRELLRLGSLRFFAQQGAKAGEPTDDELIDARRCIARLRQVLRWAAVEASLATINVPSGELEAITRDLALARRAAGPITRVMDSPPTASTPAAPRIDGWSTLGLDLCSSEKAPGSARFSLPAGQAAERCEGIAQQMGVTRIGLVGELDTLGIFIAQAFADRTGWSSSFSSGKSQTRDGARVGAIMEEVEIHAQDAFVGGREMRTSFAASTGAWPFIDPIELGLPFDSSYAPTATIDWSPAIDLIAGEPVWVPTAVISGEREVGDVLYSRRLGGKIFSTSGLGSGFSMAEAIVHAGAEIIERHAVRLAELELDNPGGIGIRDFWFVDERTLPPTPAQIVGQYRAAGMGVRILDMTSEIAVPSYRVRVFDDPFFTSSSMSADGFATHPDPEVAITMALLEAAQTRGGFISGGREDYSLQARSLGRHERPRTAVPSAENFWFGNDRPVRPFSARAGIATRDLLVELEWIVDRVERAGFERFLVVDLTIERIAPARAVRVIIPGVETTNPLCTGPRGRATAIRDLLPR